MQLIHPTLLLDEDKCQANIERMVKKAARQQVAFKPHFKTHQSAVIGEWYRSMGVKSITVSSLAMAQYFADAGWEDITLAFPVNVRAAEDIDQLAQQIQLHLFINSPESAKYMEGRLTRSVGVYVEIDTGSQRTGIPAEQESQVEDLLNELKKCSKLAFEGFYTHAGHSYKARSREEVQSVHSDTSDKLKRLRGKFESEFGPIKICIGDTPTCSQVEDWNGIDEISPGNFVFYDWMQYQIGSCTPDQIAVCMACPVVEKHPERNELIVHGGAVHFSKDFIETEGVRTFGQVVALQDNTWEKPIENVYLKALSQEHGIITAPSDFLAQVKIGDMIGILPIHSCLTANLMRRYMAEKGKLITCM